MTAAIIINLCCTLKRERTCWYLQQVLISNFTQCDVVWQHYGCILHWLWYRLQVIYQSDLCMWCCYSVIVNK